MAAADRVNPDDPSGMRRTEDRRAARMIKDLDAAVKRILEQVTPDMGPLEVQHLVGLELVGYSNETKALVLEWVEDTHQRSVLRSRTLLRSAGIPVGAVLGPAGPLPRDIQDALTVGVEESVDSLTADVKKKLTASLLEGLEAGEGAKDLGKRVAEDLAMTRTRAELIARTETMRAFNRSSLEEYRKADVSRVMWYAAMDSRSCEICGALHLTTYPIGKAPPCPAHPNCRCTLLPQA